MTLLIILNIPSVQECLVKKATDIISEKTGTEVSIQHIQLDVFSGLYAKEIYIEDTRKDTLLYARQLQVDFSFWRLYRNKKVKLKKVALSDFLVRLTKETDSTDYNFQFLVDAFTSDTSEKDTTPTKFRLVINEIDLINGRFQHEILSEPDTCTLFDVNHLFVDNIQTRIGFDMQLPTLIKANVDHLSAQERSGLVVRDIESNLQFQLDSLLLHTDRLHLQTAQSDLIAQSVSYDINRGKIDADITSSTLVGSDFKCFTTSLDHLQDPLKVKAKAHLLLPNIRIDSLYAHFANSATLYAQNLVMDDCGQWQTCQYTIHNLQFKASRDITAALKKNLGIDLPAATDSLLPATLQIDAKGTLQDIDTKIHLNSYIGEIYTSGNTRYLHEAQQLSSDNHWLVRLTDLTPVTGSNLLTKAKATVESHVDWHLTEDPNMTIATTIDSLTLLNHIYDTLTIRASYAKQKHLTADVTSKDTLLSSTINLDIQHLLEEDMETHITTDIANIQPYPLHFTDTLSTLAVAGKMKVDGTGNDVNSWIGKIEIEDLTIKKDSLQLSYDHLQVAQSQQSNGKQLSVTSPVLKGTISGEYHLDHLPINAILHPYLPSLFKEEETPCQDRFDFRFSIQGLNETLAFLGLPLSQEGETTLRGELSAEDSNIKIQLNAPSLAYNDQMVTQTRLDLRTQNKQLVGALSTQLYPDKADTFYSAISSTFEIRNDSIFNNFRSITQPDTSFLQGDIRDCISFHATSDSLSNNLADNKFGDNNFSVQADIYPSTIKINGQPIHLQPASITILDKNIEVQNVGLEMNDKPVFRAHGNISEKITDTLSVSVDNLQLQTILSLLLINDLPANCAFSGNIQAAAILGDNSRFFTRNFHVDSIVYQDLYMGDMTMKAMWDNTRGGVFAKMDLVREEQHMMSIKGVVVPAKQFVKMRAQLDSIPLSLAQPFAAGYASNLGGELAANILVEGELSSPSIKGCIHFIDTKAKIDYTGVSYTISDSISLDGNYFYAKKFRIRDEKGNSLTLNGEITHNKFQTFDYNMRLNMRDFMLLNNPKAHSNTVYGNFSINGNNLLLKGTEKEATLTGSISNAENCNLNVILPESFTEAYSNDNIIYVKSEADSLSKEVEETRDTTNAFDMTADINIGLTDKASFYINVVDGAMVRGNGNLHLTYEDGNIGLYNRFTVSDGFMKVRLSGLPTKKFSIQEGSYVEFNGDPMKLKFNATASYALTADLSTLSSSFSSLGLGSTRVPVSCDLVASGDLDNLSLAYDVSLPKADDNIKQSVNSIINTDNIRIKEFAYLIGLGMFNDPSGQVENDMLMSFASSSLSSTLNNVLGNVIGDKVTLGAGVNSAKEDMSDVEVSVSVSTKLFNDRLLLSTNLGYQNQEENSSNSSFMGDFDAEYLLGKTGMFRIKGYNHTNNDFYRSSNNTQGLGFTFVRESKTLKSLFKLKNNNPSPADTTKRRDDKKRKEEKNAESDEQE